jgi:hypothetical protein
LTHLECNPQMREKISHQGGLQFHESEIEMGLPQSNFFPLSREKGAEKRGWESFLDARGGIAIDALIKCRGDLVYQLVVSRTMS